MKGPNCAMHKVCEGPVLHIRGRDKNGCAQFQDGSWITKNRDVCRERHSGTPMNGGQAAYVRALIESARR